MDMRLPPGLAAAKEAPPPLRLLQRWTPASPPTIVPAPPHGWAACRQALRRLFLAR